MEEKIKILYEDNFLLAIDKPAGMVVNKAVSAKGLTVQEWAEKYLNIKSAFKKTFGAVDNNSIEYEFATRGGVVHRLDKETSGVLIIAKSPEVFGRIKQQFLERTVAKEYTALAHGRIEPMKGTIDGPIGRLPWNRMRFGVIADGRSATTDYEVLGYRKYDNENLTVVRLFPKTGRTHQIRVHLLHMGNPIFADELYAGRKQSKKDRRVLGRHFLHASKILFKHPDSGVDTELASELPEDLNSFLSSLSE